MANIAREPRLCYYFRSAMEEKTVFREPVVREIRSKSILSKSGIDGISYCINPYVGCAHGCRYCYASFMKRFTGHREPWGCFVDAKANSPILLEKQLKSFQGGRILVGTVTDPYQPSELRFRLTRNCLEVLAGYPHEVSVLTKSSLVLRDIDILKHIRHIEVGVTVTTDDDDVRRLFEPGAPPIKERTEALRILHDAGISTYAFIGPVLPMHPERLAEEVGPYICGVIIDRMNYSAKTRSIYRRNGIEEWLDGGASNSAVRRLREKLSAFGVARS